MKKRKVYRIAKELNLAIDIILSYMEELKIDVSKKKLTVVDEKCYLQVLKHFNINSYNDYNDCKVEEKHKKEKNIEERKTFDNLLKSTSGSSDFKNGQVVTGTVTHITDYAAFIDIGASEDAFLHHSDIDDIKVSNIRDYLKESEKVKVIIKNINEDKILVSIKLLIEQQKKEYLESLAVGDVIQGTIKHFTTNNQGKENSAIISLNKGTTYLNNIHRLSEKLTIGQNISVIVTKINLEQNKIAVSRRKYIKKQIRKCLKTLTIGDVLQVTVKDFIIVKKKCAVIVTLVPGFDAIMYKEEVPCSRLDEPTDVLSIGQNINVIITTIYLEQNRIIVSRKQLLEKSISSWEKIGKKLTWKKVRYIGKLNG